MNKVVVLIDQDPIIQGIAMDMDEMDKQHQNRMEFIEKQQKDAEKDFHDRQEPLLNAVLNKLLADGKLKDFDKEKHHLHVDSDANVVVLCDGEHKRGHPMLEALAKAGIIPIGPIG